MCSAGREQLSQFLKKATRLLPSIADRSSVTSGRPAKATPANQGFAGGEQKPVRREGFHSQWPMQAGGGGRRASPDMPPGAGRTGSRQVELYRCGK